MTSTSEPTHLVVALPHVRPVLAALDEASKASDGTGPLYADPTTSDVLDLALVPLLNPEGAAAALKEWSPAKSSAKSPLEHPSLAEDAPPLDHILWQLRAGFEHRYFGWTPLLGKNRMVGQVHGQQKPSSEVTGAGEISHGGGGAPSAITQPAWAAKRKEVAPNGVAVGLVDTAMVNHDYLTGAWTGPYPGARDGRPVYAEHGHATFIAGLIRQYAPAATLRLLPILDGRGEANAWTTAHQIVEAARAGVDVLNLSFVCYTQDGAAPLVLATALERLGSSTVVVAAAGNHGFLGGGEDHKPAYPAAFPNVIAVGADNAAGTDSAPFSAKGPWITVQAPGTNLESTYLSGTVSVWQDPDGDGPAPNTRRDEQFGGYARWSGTSFAAAVVSGMIAARTVPGRRSAAEASAQLLGRAWADGEPVRLTPEGQRHPVG